VAGSRCTVSERITRSSTEVVLVAAPGRPQTGSSQIRPAVRLPPSTSQVSFQNQSAYDPVYERPASSGVLVVLGLSVLLIEARVSGREVKN
jgi:hypothetical protein